MFNSDMYISGWEALNLPTENGNTADWHYLNYPPIAKFKHNKTLGDKGIKKRFIKELNRVEKVASYARAIADLVINNQTNGLRNCVYDFLDDDEAKELYSYLKLEQHNKNVENFMKYELTKLYFADKSEIDETISTR